MEDFYAQPGWVIGNLQAGQGLKNCDLFKKMDPYVIMSCAHQTFQSKYVRCGGRNPVWNESFSFKVDREMDISFTVMDHDLIGKDDVVGQGHIPLLRVRQLGSDTLRAPVTTNGREMGYVQVSLTFHSDRGPAANPYCATAPPMIAPLRPLGAVVPSIPMLPSAPQPGYASPYAGGYPAGRAFGAPQAAACAMGAPPMQGGPQPYGFGAPCQAYGAPQMGYVYGAPPRYF